jgi:tRNA pseudouridine38-40 synthase
VRFAACVEYDGSGFSGWQAQKHDVRTVQAEVQAALSRVANEPIAIITAGRTDAGVHATHQVIHFDSEAPRDEFSWCRGTNRFLAKDIRLHWVSKISSEFHARFSASNRSYRFIILNQSIQSALYRRHVTHEFRPLDTQKMATAGKLLLGEHDFSSFRAAGCQAHSPVRSVQQFNLSSNGSWVWFDIRANAFLQHMVRNIAGCLIEIGSGKRDPHWIADLLQEKDRTKGGKTAPANGLYLVGVAYPSEFALPSVSRPVSYWGQ